MAAALLAVVGEGLGAAALLQLLAAMLSRLLAVVLLVAVGENSRVGTLLQLLVAALR